MQRYFVSKKDNMFYLQESDFHHVKDVMRIKDGGEIICIYENQSFLCKINYKSNSYEINVIKDITKDVELVKDVILYQALIKNDKFDFVIQKATELGVSTIYPTIFSRSIIKVSDDKKDNKLNRYQKIIKEACEQSCRQKLPEIKPYIDVKKLTLDEDTLGLIAYENNGQYDTLFKALNEINNYKKIAVVIGPEGGFEESEVKYLLSVGFKSVSLGKRILRSETASMYALSVIAYTIEGM